MLIYLLALLVFANLFCFYLIKAFTLGLNLIVDCAIDSVESIGEKVVICFLNDYNRKW